MVRRTWSRTGNAADFGPPLLADGRHERKPVVIERREARPIAAPVVVRTKKPLAFIRGISRDSLERFYVRAKAELAIYGFELGRDDINQRTVSVASKHGVACVQVSIRRGGKEFSYSGKLEDYEAEAPAA